jgi:hypothetical protein
MCIQDRSTVVKAPLSAKLEPKKRSIIAIVSPLIAALLHLHVFYYAAFKLLAEPIGVNGIGLFTERAFGIDKAVFMAYAFDIFCCYVLKVVPFSRCHLAKDIADHHLPIILVILPLGIPLWANNFDPIMNSLLRADNGEKEIAWSIAAINAIRCILGLGFLSSLNEVIMCFQRVEMTINGIDSFSHTSQIKNKVMTGRLMIGIELYFKVAVFCFFSIAGFKVCCDLDKVYYSYYMHTNEGASFWNALSAIFTSTTIWRTILFRLFLVSMYPFMGLRTIRKVIKFHEEGMMIKRKIN